jgi:N-methylhydantoinase A/oxoprolinase/acetone carboxylase beta subunit
MKSDGGFTAANHTKGGFTAANHTKGGFTAANHTKGGFTAANHIKASQLLLSGPAGGLIGCQSIISTL